METRNSAWYRSQTAQIEKVMSSMREIANIPNKTCWESLLDKAKASNDLFFINQSANLLLPINKKMPIENTQPEWCRNYPSAMYDEAILKMNQKTLDQIHDTKIKIIVVDHKYLTNEYFWDKFYNLK